MLAAVGFLVRTKEKVYYLSASLRLHLGFLNYGGYRLGSPLG